MNPIILKNPEHIYTHIDSGTIYHSMSNVVGNFKKKFDIVYWSKRKAYEDLVPGFPAIAKKYKEGDYTLFDELDSFIKNKPLFEIYVNNYLHKWKKKGDDSRSSGTLYHSVEETKDLKRGYAINPENGKPYIVYSTNDFDPYNIKPGCYLETCLHDPNTLIAGTPDKFFLCYEDHQLWIDLFDHKTNEDLFKPVYKNEKFLKPLNHLLASKINGYALAMSGYLYMLSLLGAKPRSSYILYSPDKINTGTYKMPVIINDAKLMMETYYKNIILNK